MDLSLIFPILFVVRSFKLVFGDPGVLVPVVIASALKLKRDDVDRFAEVKLQPLIKAATVILRSLKLETGSCFFSPLSRVKEV